MVEGGAPRGAASILEGEALRSGTVPPPSHRPAPTRRAEHAGVVRERGLPEKPVHGTGRSFPERESHAIHDRARRAADPAVSLHRADGHLGRLADRRPYPARAGRTDRILREPPRLAPRPFGLADVPRAAAPCARDDARGLCASGPSLRE